MSEWIESHASLRDHPKTKRLARALGVSVPTAIGHLHCLWWFAMEYAPDGVLGDFDPEEIAEAAGWGGEPDAFLEALRRPGPRDQSGFLDPGDVLHDWDDYGGKQHYRRARDAERKREYRARQKAVAEGLGDEPDEPDDAPEPDLPDDLESPSAGRPPDVTGESASTRPTGQDRQDRTGSRACAREALPVENKTTTAPELHRLTTLARDVIPGWKSSPKDDELVRLALADLPEEQVERTIRNLATKQTARAQYRDLRKTLANWLSADRDRVAAERKATRTGPASTFVPPEELSPEELAANRAAGLVAIRQTMQQLKRGAIQ